MAQTVRLPDELMTEIKIVAQAENRSIPKQVEHWISIGKMVEDNPDLTYELIRGVMLAKAQADHGAVLPYVRITKRD